MVVSERPVDAPVADSSALLPTWYGTVPESTARRALELADAVAARLRDPGQVVALAMRAADQAVHPMGWHPPGFAGGHAGIALLHVAAAQAATGAGRRSALDAAHQCIREAVAGTRIMPLDEPGLFAGTSGLALCVAECCLDEPRFRPSLDRLRHDLADQVLAGEPTCTEREVAEADYDLVSGAAGVLAHLSSVDDPDPRVRSAIARLAGDLAWLGGAPDDSSLPHRWLIAPHRVSAHERALRHYPGGYLNLGAAHGVPGVLAALATAVHTGHDVPGAEAALARMTAWILGAARIDAHGPCWPTEVPVSLSGAQLPPQLRPDQAAWCYGSAGVSVCLLAAADATGDAMLRATAIEAFEAALRRRRPGVPASPTLCHGTAGLLLLSLEFAHRTGGSVVAAHAASLLAELLAQADPDRPLLFADEDEPGNRVDSPALLTGATGVALVLYAVVAQRRPAWLHAFLAR